MGWSKLKRRPCAETRSQAERWGTKPSVGAVAEEADTLSQEDFASGAPQPTQASIDQLYESVTPPCDGNASATRPSAAHSESFPAAAFFVSVWPDKQLASLP
jgi:hypothetical protein